MIGLGMLGLGLGLTANRPVSGEESGPPAWVTAGGFDDWVDYDEELSTAGFAGLLSGNYIDLPTNLAGGISWYFWGHTTDAQAAADRIILDFSDGSDTNRHMIYRANSQGGPRVVNASYYSINPTFGAWDGSAITPLQVVGSFANGFGRCKFNNTATDSGSGSLSTGSAINKLGVGTKGFSSTQDMQHLVKHRLGVIYGAGDQGKFDAMVGLFQ